MSPPIRMHPNMFSALLSAPDPARLKHFIGRCADSETVWALSAGDAWAAIIDETGTNVFPVWPHPDFALACAVENWVGCMPVEISVYAFAGNWLPGMADRGDLVEVFRTPLAQGVRTQASRLRHLLAEELRRYG